MFAPEAGARAAPAPSRMPFPLGPKPEAAVPEAQPHNEPAIEGHPLAAPALRNPARPDVAAEQLEVEEYEAVSLSPQQPAPAPAEPDAPEPPSSISDDAMPVAGMRPVPPLEPPPWHTAPLPKPPERPSQPSYFDAMWPAEPRPQKREPLKPEAPKLQAPEIAERTGRDPEIGRGRRHGLHALRRRLDRSRTAARHAALRLDQRIARSSRPQFLIRTEKNKPSLLPARRHVFGQSNRKSSRVFDVVFLAVTGFAQ